MTMQSSGKIWISEIKSEHGDTSGQDGLSEYYRKGRNSKPVPDNDKNDAVPKSGKISMSNFYDSVGTFSTFHTFTLAFSTGKVGGGVSSSMSPSTMWTGAGGVTIDVFGVSGGSTQIVTVSMSGNRSKSYFSKILIAGATRYTNTCNHSYNGGTGKTSWSFPDAVGGLANGGNNFWMYE